MKQSRLNGIITLETSGETLSEECSIDSIVCTGDAGDINITDLAGNAILHARLTSDCACLCVPVWRTVIGVKAQALQTNQTVYIYLKKGNQYGIDDDRRNR